MRVRVIGVGTPHGDDAAGLAVAERLRTAGLPPGATATTCQRPGLDLPPALAGSDAAVVVDAMHSGAPPGSVRRLSSEALPRLRALSSHGLGLTEGLALAEALGQRPARLVLVGIEGELASGEGLSPPVRRGVEDAARLVRAVVSELLEGGGHSGA